MHNTSQNRIGELKKRVKEQCGTLGSLASTLEDNPWTITIGNETIPFFISTTNGTHTFLYFTYIYNQGWFTTSKISIKGTWAVPEITPNVLLLFFIITTFLASTLHRRKQHNLK